MRIAPLFAAAKTAALTISSIRLETAVAVDVAARHHDWVDEQLQADGTLEALRAHYADDLVGVHSLLEV